MSTPCQDPEKCGVVCYGECMQTTVKMPYIPSYTLQPYDCKSCRLGAFMDVAIELELAAYGDTMTPNESEVVLYFARKFRRWAIGQERL